MDTPLSCLSSPLIYNGWANRIILEYDYLSTRLKYDGCMYTSLSFSGISWKVSGKLKLIMTWSVSLLLPCLSHIPRHPLLEIFCYIKRTTMSFPWTTSKVSGEHKQSMFHFSHNFPCWTSVHFWQLANFDVHFENKIDYCKHVDVYGF